MQQKAVVPEALPDLQHWAGAFQMTRDQQFSALPKRKHC